MKLNFYFPELYFSTFFDIILLDQLFFCIDFKKYAFHENIFNILLTFKPFTYQWLSVADNGGKDGASVETWPTKGLFNEGEIVSDNPFRPSLMFNYSDGERD